jgi:hypothetical protein
VAKHKPKHPEPGGKISANDYIQAARDHAASLERLYSGGHYASVMYVSGLAAECLFRGFRASKGLPFTSDHQLAALSEEAGFADIIPPHAQARFGAALADLILRWRNNHRFRSIEAVRRFLRDLKLYRGIKGDFIKENARILASSALELVNLGVAKWH